MDKLPNHLRITGLSVTNEDVDSRRKAVAELSTSWSRSKGTAEIVAKAAEIAVALGGDGVPPAGLASEIEIAVQKHASAFLSADRPLEVGICSGVAMVNVMSGDPGNSGWLIADIYAYALWSALAFQPALQEEKREQLRLEVLEAARDRSLKSADAARERVNVPELGDIVVTIDDAGKATTNFKKVVQPTIDALRRNSALDREELDFLWWAQLTTSRAIGRPLTDLNAATRLIAAGVEGAGMLRRLPGDVHREIVLRTLDGDAELDLLEVVAALGDDRPKLAARIRAGAVQAAAPVYPLLNAIITGNIVGDGAPVKRRLSEWAARALLETALAKISEDGPAPVSRACNFDGCTVGETGSCALERNPDTCEHRLAATGGFISPAGAAEVDATNSLGAPVLDQPVTIASFPSSRTLGPETITAMMGNRYVTVVGILGDPESGKTACLASLYLLIANAKLAGWTYANSASLTGFEEIARGAREWNEGQPPDQMTVHTELSDDRRPGFLHLRLMRKSDGRRVDFALPDLPGEWTTDLVTSSRADRFEFMKSADVLWIVVDGRSLADRERRQGVISRLGQLVGRLITIFGGDVPRLLLVATHRDGGELGAVIEERIATELAKKGLVARIVQVAPFSSTEMNPGFGIDELIDATVGEVRPASEFWPTRLAAGGGRAFIQFRRDR